MSRLRRPPHTGEPAFSGNRPTAGPSRSIRRKRPLHLGTTRRGIGLRTRRRAVVVRPEKAAGSRPASTLLSGSGQLPQLVEHPIDRSHGDGNVSLADFQMRVDAGNAPAQPLTVAERDHQVGIALPERDGHGDCGQVETPGTTERHVVVEPAVHRAGQPVVKRRGDVVADLAGKAARSTSGKIVAIESTICAASITRSASASPSR